jgi:hypothetical protein
MFQVVSYSAGTGEYPGRIDIDTNGNVTLVTGYNGYASLDGIIFVAGGTWTNGSFASGSTNFGSPFANFHYLTDSQGRAHVEGLIKPTSGTTYTNGALLATLPAAYRPSLFMTMPSASYLYGGLSFYNSGAINARSTGSTYWSLQWLYYPSSFNSWNTLNMSSYGYWQNYDASSFTPGQCYKGSDDVVIIRGLIRGTIFGGTNGSTIANTNTSGCGVHGDGQLLLSGWKSDELDARIDLTATGNLVMQRGSSTWTSLDQVHFIAD